MARPYMSPAKRKRAGMSDNPMSEPGPGETMEQPAPESPGQAEDEESGSVFLPPSVLGGKQWKPGDEIVLKIKAVDPQTGEAEAVYAPEKGGDSEPQDTMAAMDQRFPEEGASY